MVFPLLLWGERYRFLSTSLTATWISLLGSNCNVRFLVKDTRPSRTGFISDPLYLPLEGGETKEDKGENRSEGPYVHLFGILAERVIIAEFDVFVKNREHVA